MMNVREHWQVRIDFLRWLCFKGLTRRKRLSVDQLVEVISAYENEVDDQTSFVEFLVYLLKNKHLKRKFMTLGEAARLIREFIAEGAPPIRPRKPLNPLTEKARSAVVGERIKPC